MSTKYALLPLLLFCFIIGCTGDSGYEYCFLYEEGGEYYYVDEGSMYMGDRFLGTTNQGCVYPTDISGCENTELTFVPESTLRFNFSIVSSVSDYCGSSTQLISNETYELFSKLSNSAAYLDAIEPDENSLRSTATSQIDSWGCHGTDTTCVVNSLFYLVADNISYVSDPRGVEKIQSPDETVSIGGGDCEDLAILLISYLENLGVKTYLVLGDDHAYALACGLDYENQFGLWQQVLKAQLEVVVSDNIVIQTDHFLPIGFVEEPDYNYFDVLLDMESDGPVNVLFFPEYGEYEKRLEEQLYYSYLDCNAESVYDFYGVCSLDAEGGVIIENPLLNDDVIVDYMTAIAPSDNDIYYEVLNYTYTIYDVEGEDCYVLDPSTGPWGYVGYDANVTGVKLAVDPVTYGYFYI
jgi:hypothetical protein